MDDTTQKIVTNLAIGAVQKVLIGAAAAATAHGFISGAPTETYLALATIIVTYGVSFWKDYGRAIVESQLELLKARSLAAAAKIQAAGLKPVTVAEIAAQSDKLTEASVTKVAATLPADIQASVVPIKAAS